MAMQQAPLNSVAINTINLKLDELLSHNETLRESFAVELKKLNDGTLVDLFEIHTCSMKRQINSCKRQILDILSKCTVPTPITVNEKKQQFHCSECDASFPDITSWNTHECDSDSDDESDSDSDSSSSDDDIDLKLAGAANSKPKQKRLLINDAIQNTETMDNWSKARKKAFNNRLSNENEFYYRFSAKGISQNDNEQRQLLMVTNSGTWSNDEHKLFMARILEFGVNGQWGIFSKTIPSRVGYSCQQYWQRLIRMRCVEDMNYVWVGAKKWIWKWNNGIGKDIKELQQCKRYGFKVIMDKDETGVWKDDPKQHANYPDEKLCNTLDQEYSKYFSKKYVEYVNKQNQGNASEAIVEPPAKRQKTE